MNHSANTQIIQAIRSVVAEREFVALHEPFFAGNEWDYVKECLDTAWVSSVGSYVDKFELDLARYTGARAAIVTVNGTAALHACLLLCDVHPGDEVLTPSFTFVATTNAITYCQAQPHFVDIEAQTMGVDPLALEEHLQACARREGDSCYNRQTGKRIGALVVMHAFGHPARLDAIANICEAWNIPLIEDAAESLGSLYQNRHTGLVGRCAALSFNGNKVITTGGGGAILTGDIELAKRAKHLTTTAKQAHPWRFFHDQTGYNYRMPNLNAALGCAQLEQLDSFVTRKRALADRYQQAFATVETVRFVQEPPLARSNYWLNNIVLLDDEPDLDTLCQLARDEGLQCRPSWEPMHTLAMYQQAPRAKLPETEQMAARLLSVPSSVFL